jgi:pyruvate,orthophosphate dikinase
MQKKWIYSFSLESKDGDASMIDLLGSKGAYLADMCKIDIPIPPGFTISTELCHYYLEHNVFPDGFLSMLAEAVEKLNRQTNKIFGSAINPLLVSVRSGAKISMPGMMDTILNVGLTPKIISVVSKDPLSASLMLDSYSRLLESYGTAIFKIDSAKFHCAYTDVNDIIAHKNAAIKDHNAELPNDPYEQLIKAIIAVIKSWKSSRAIAYRKFHNISESLGTAVTVQSMVFGNNSGISGTGVVFSRNPATGSDEIYGEYLNNAQGEDIVAGIKTPHSIGSYMKLNMPHIYQELVAICKKLEDYYNDVQDIEFTVEDSKLYVLQSRRAKRTASAAIKIAVDLCNEGKISREQALCMLKPKDLKKLMHPNVIYNGSEEIIMKGLAASPGAAWGKIILSTDKAIELSKTENVILVRHDTSPEDIEAMYLSQGFLTATGGLTSHAAVIARGLGTPCVCSANFVINYHDNTISCNDVIYKEGDIITIDGTTGQIAKGKLNLSDTAFTEEFFQIIQWSLEYNKIKVRANAETLNDIKNSIRFGAAGIGLCRSEHMFFENNKIRLLQEIIISQNIEHKQNILDKLKLLHQADYEEIFAHTQGLPINIRLLDPPLHEFLPQTQDQIEDLAAILHLPIDSLVKDLKLLHEVNPMLGKRGCRLGLLHPEIYIMQIEAIFAAKISIKAKYNFDVDLEIMIPFLSDKAEFEALKKTIDQIASSLNQHNYKVGGMLEIPRAALLADTIATSADYFSFGTNDLTQTIYGLSRDDSGKFLQQYLDKKIYEFDPFVELDQEGVGAIMSIAINKARQVKPNISFSICGEHACHQSGIDFAIMHDINYVSCSPYNIPIAILTIAQKQIANKQLN